MVTPVVFGYARRTRCWCSEAGRAPPLRNECTVASGGAPSGWRSVRVILRTILVMLVASMPSTTVAQTAEEKQAIDCPHPEWMEASGPPAHPGES
jgi:hypothetical protein